MTENNMENSTAAAESRSIPKGTFALISLCFFLSGLCGLVYQILWIKMLGLIFGHTAFAATTVVSTFLGGLALGSFIMGRWADKTAALDKIFGRFGGSRYIAAYCFMEILVGVFCFLTPVLFRGVELIYFQVSDLSFGTLTVIRFFLCAAVMILPTMAMGATLPLMSKYLITSRSEVGTKLGFIYAINTAGSVIGAFLAGFLLLPSIGLSATLALAAIINIGIGILLLSFNRGIDASHESAGGAEEENQTETADAEVKDEKDNDRGKKLLVLFSVIFAASGFASLMYELAWNRGLALALGSSTYAFSAMLTTYLFGTALGSFIFSKTAKKNPPTYRHFALVQMAIGLSSALFIPLIGRLPIIFGDILPYIRHSYNLVITVDFLLCFAAMLIPVIFIGISFPMAGNIYTQKLSVLGKSIGDIYAINTIGSVTGSIITGFFLMPAIGVQNTILTAVCVNILGANLLFFGTVEPARKKIALSLASLLILIGAFSLPRWDLLEFSRGYFRGLKKAATAYRDTHEILYYKDGISSTVTVVRGKTDGIISLAVNGKTDASTGGDMSTQILLGLLPVLNHPAPSEALVIGLGSGTTVAAAAAVPAVKHVECVELEPDLIDAAKFFTPHIGDIYNNAKCTIKVADGRNYLSASRKKYDIIISEPSNPWIAGVASLFTSEFFASCKNSLNEGGVACIWLQLYSIDAESLRMIVNTLHGQFPHIQFWMAPNANDLLILCSEDPIVFQYDRYRSDYEKNPEMKKFADQVFRNDPDELLAFYMADETKLQNMIYGARLNTDNLPLLEYEAPRLLYMMEPEVHVRNIALMKDRLFPPVTSPVSPNEAFFASQAAIFMSIYNIPADKNIFIAEGKHLPAVQSTFYWYTLEEKGRESLDRLKELARQNPDNEFCQQALAFALNAVLDYEGAEQIYRTQYETDPNPERAVRYLQALSRSEKYEEIVRFTDGYLENRSEEDGPVRPDIYTYRMQAFSRQNKIAEAMEAAEHLYSTGNNSLRYEIAQIYFDGKEYEKALAFIYKVYESEQPTTAKTCILLSKVLLTKNHFSEAALVAGEGLAADGLNQELLQLRRRAVESLRQQSN